MTRHDGSVAGRSRGLAAVLSSAAGLLMACAEELSVSLEGADDVEAVLIAQLSGSEIDRVHIARLDHALRVASTVPRLVMFELSGADVDKVHPRRASDREAEGACGRCVHTGVSGQLIPGSSCPPSAEVRAWSFGVPGLAPGALISKGSEEAKSIDSIRRALRLDRPGACPFEDVDLTAVRELELRFVHPRADAWPIDSIAIDDVGNAALFATSYAAYIDSAGQREERSGGLPFVGRPTGAVPLESGSFLVQSWEGTRDTEARLDVFDAELSDSEVFPGGDGASTTGAFRTLSPAESAALGRRGEVTIFVAGRVNHDLASVALCSREPGWSCGRLAPRGFLPLGVDHALSGSVISEGRLLVGASNGWASLGSRSVDGSWTWESHGVPEASGGWLTTSTVAGSRVLACADHLSEGVSRTLLLAAELDTWPVSWTRIYEGIGECLTFFRTLGSGLHLLRRFADELLEIDVATLEVTELPWGAIGWTSPPRLFSSSGSHFLTALASGAFRGSSTATVALERVYGSDALDQRFLLPVRTGTDLIEVIDEALGSAVLGENGLSELPPRHNPVAPDHLVVFDAQSDPSGNVLTVGHRLPSQLADLRKIDAHRTETHVFDVGLPPRVRVLAAAALGPDAYVVIADEWRIFRLSGSDLEPVGLDWDDPSTPAVETAPELLRCPDYRVGAGEISERTWRAVGAAGGVAWAVGCGGVIMRIGSTGQATRVELPQEGGASDRLADFTAVHVLAPDRALVAASPGVKLEAGAEREVARVLEVWVDGDTGEARVSRDSPIEDVRLPLASVETVDGSVVAVQSDGSIWAAGARRWYSLSAELRGGLSWGRRAVFTFAGPRVLVVSGK
ncbi:MAG: hypothetical protein HYV07_16795 [Deltaproteobacteria bacterium]|nr:hypothetical protein [Deltaproteobacteria bacterium]